MIAEEEWNESRTHAGRSVEIVRILHLDPSNVRMEIWLTLMDVIRNVFLKKDSPAQLQSTPFAQKFVETMY